MCPPHRNAPVHPAAPREGESDSRPDTHFASPERSSQEEILRQHRVLCRDATIQHILNGYPEPVVVLDRNRQIVLTNDKLTELLGRSPESLLGRRPGEALACVHSGEMPAGCGTSRFCKHCGAAQALVESGETSQAQVKECRITREVDQCESSLDLRVWATPITVEGETYTLFAIRDTTDEKRRQALERIFFHDVLNVAGGLRGLAELLQYADEVDFGELHHEIGSASSQLVEEIIGQRDLAAAEQGELDCTLTDVDAASLLQRIQSTYTHHMIAIGKTIDVDPPPVGESLNTDATLLSRVLGNLVKNALEASQAGQTIRIAYRNNGSPEFTVWNESVMPEEVALQLFQRSFSTKEGTGRGLGSYSVKLLTEQYLGGEVSFRSEEGLGTTFTVRLPAAPDS